MDTLLAIIYPLVSSHGICSIVLSIIILLLSRAGAREVKTAFYRVPDFHFSPRQTVGAVVHYSNGIIYGTLLSHRLVWC